MQFKDKVVIVTGGANGIGKAIASAFLEEDALVVCMDNAVSSAVVMGKDKKFILPVDVSKADSCKKAVELSGYPDVLVNCAGIQPLKSYRRVHELDEEVWDRVIDTNLKGYFLMAKYCLPRMMRQHKGVIINVASVTTHAAAKNISAYAASKAGILSLTRSIALEYAEYEIRCVACLSRDD